MAKKPLPSPEVLRQLLRYEPDTGKLFWRERGPEWFVDQRSQKIWNTKHAGREAGANLKGYVFVRLDGGAYLAHRLVWKMITGGEPNVIDHINGDRSDNRICNLRDVTHEQNMKNVGMYSTNKSGITGVYWDTDRVKWSVTGRIDGKSKNVGRFDCLGRAIRARHRFLEVNKFHAGHGLRRSCAKD
ncbi:HNH endonuclease [Sulfitobacter sp. PM12]|uniref:HNH endonuclease n=1 Tax=Sulfitobacter sp. PM12 TaxID=3138497 RepID=UPI00388DB27C